MAQTAVDALWVARDALRMYKNLHKDHLAPSSLTVLDPYANRHSVVYCSLHGFSLPPVAVCFSFQAHEDINSIRERLEPVIIELLGKNYRYHIRARLLTSMRVKTARELLDRAA